MARSEGYFQGIGLKVVTGSHYPGGFIGYQETETTLSANKVHAWTDLVRTL